MKQLIITIALLVFALNAKSQDIEIHQELRQGLRSDTIVYDDNDSADESKSSIHYDGTPYSVIFAWGGKKDSKKNLGKLDSHWTGVGISFLNYDKGETPQSRLRRGPSYAITFNPISWKKPILTNNLQVVSGIGFDWFRYHFDSNTALTEVDGMTQFVPAPNGITYKDSKLLAYYITVPLLLEYHLSRNSVYVSAGVVGYIKYYSKSQVKYYDEHGVRHRPNQGRDLNLLPVDMKVRFQFGIKDVSTYFYYSPFSMFDKKNGPDMKVYGIGFMLIL